MDKTDWLPLVFALLVAAPVVSSHAHPPETVRQGSCKAEVMALRQIADGPDKSDATCDYDFAEFNRRLANLLEVSSGTYTTAYLEKLLAMPPMQKRPDIGPNPSYRVMAEYSIVLAGKGGWSAKVEINLRKADIIPGRRSDVRISARPTYPSVYADPKQSNCITEAEMLDRAIAAGWRYELLSGDLHQPMDGKSEFFTAQLSKDDGRILNFSTLPDKSGAPPRATLEATCWIGATFDEKRILKRE